LAQPSSVLPPSRPPYSGSASQHSTRAPEATDEDWNFIQGCRPGSEFPEDLAHLLERGLGITSLVAGALARADELTMRQLITGAEGLSERVERVAPAVMAVLGITAYRTAFARPQATVWILSVAYRSGWSRTGTP
jgi:hypothetical protein